MFLLHLEDTSPVSSVGDPSDPGYSPIYLELDSTDLNPPPSPWVRGYLSLPAGYISLKDEIGNIGGATIRFEGTTAGLWELTNENPSLIVEPTVTQELRLSVEDNTPTSFWLRAKTTYGEVPVDDRSVALRVSGQVQEV
jgi:hypothetical protein